MTPIGCAVGPPIAGQLNLEGIPVLGLVDTGASVTCMGFSVWWQYRTQWGPLKPLEGVVHGAHSMPLQIVGKTQHLNLQWGKARGRATFIVIIGLKSPPVLIGMDIMQPLQVHIDVTRSTATPAHPSTLTPPRLRVLPPASLYCYKRWAYPSKQRVWSAATTPGPARMYTSARRKACPHLCL